MNTNILAWLVTLFNVSNALSDYTGKDNGSKSYTLEIIKRDIWHARAPNNTTPLTTPVPYVVIHHSYTPKACYNRSDCSKAMRSMQDYHMNDQGWRDIGYHFGVGSNGDVFEGRGWSTLGAHALHFNSVSLGICLIGDWSEKVPPPHQIRAAKELILTGVELGFIKKNYKLVGHRQVRDTVCPGDALFQEIQNWLNYSSFPRSAADLPEVKELPDSVKELLTNNIIIN